jgi:hypothetical protein
MDQENALKRRVGNVVDEKTLTPLQEIVGSVS